MKIWTRKDVDGLSSTSNLGLHILIPLNVAITAMPIITSLVQKLTKARPTLFDIEKMTKMSTFTIISKKKLSMRLKRKSPQKSIICIRRGVMSHLNIRLWNWLVISLTIVIMNTIREKLFIFSLKHSTIWGEISVSRSWMFGVGIPTVGSKMLMNRGKRLQIARQNWIDFERSRRV